MRKILEVAAALALFLLVLTGIAVLRAVAESGKLQHPVQLQQQ